MVNALLRYVVLITALCCVSLYFYADSVSIRVFKSPTEGYAEFFQIWSGLMAFIAMTVSLLLSTRLGILNNFFGGLDKSYWLHKLNGYLITFLAVLHFSKTSGTFNKNELFVSTLHEEATIAGNLLFWVTAILVIITVVKKIGNKTLLQYNTWKLLHKLFVVVYFGIIFHFVAINKPYPGGSSIDTFMVVVAVVGILSLLNRAISFGLSRADYMIDEITRIDDVTKLVIKPCSKKRLSPKPGQFAFLAFPDSPNLTEPHPFTIAESDKAGNLTFFIKASGDFTMSVAEDLVINAKVRVEGPHGKFLLPEKPSRHTIWIAGGIGVTPFISFSTSLAARNTKVSMLYVVKSRSQAFGVNFFEKLANFNKDFYLKIVSTNEDGRPNAKTVSSLLPRDCTEVDVYFCGPVKLRKACKQHLSQLGIKVRKMNFEVFAFR